MWCGGGDDGTLSLYDAMTTTSWVKKNRKNKNRSVITRKRCVYILISRVCILLLLTISFFFRFSSRKNKISKIENMRATLTRRLRHGAKLLGLKRLSRYSIESSGKRHVYSVRRSCMIVQTFSTERRRDVSERKKKQVAFSQEYKCASCGMMLPPDYAIDHIVPIALGGHNGFRNLQALCLKCHKLKTQMKHYQTKIQI